MGDGKKLSGLFRLFKSSVERSYKIVDTAVACHEGVRLP